MRRLFVAFLFLTAACSKVAQPEATAIPTQTPFILPSALPVKTTPTPLPVIVTPTPTAEPKTYTVEPGNTLVKIAQNFGVSVLYLADLNGINNPNRIKVGDVLKIEGQVTPPEAPFTQGKVILAILGKQRVYVYENGALLKEFIVSSGRATHETVTGIFRIQAKYELAHMVGPDYDVDSPWTEYFGNALVSWHEGYSLHGAPWNHDLGTPHSHGCLNMSVEDAKWLFAWTDPVATGSETYSPDINTGTLVVIVN